MKEKVLYTIGGISMPSMRIRADYGLDAAVHDALVVFSTPWLCTLTGFLAGLLTISGLPILLFYNACILRPSALLGHLPAQSPYPACAANLAAGYAGLVYLWPFLFGTIGATYGWLRRSDLADELHWRWKHKRIRPFHVFACLAGYFALLAAVWIAGSWHLIVNTPLLAVLAGPALVLVWQYLHDKFLFFIVRPTWGNLVANTVCLWFPRRLNLPRQAITKVQANIDGHLEVRGQIAPSLVDEAGLLARALPGISHVSIYNPNGERITATSVPKLSAAVEAGRIVAQLRRNRTQIFSTGGYTNRHEVVFDYSIRLLIATTGVVVLVIAITLFWAALRGNFRPITPEDLQWFFGKYGSGASSSDIQSLPKSMRPPTR